MEMGWSIATTIAGWLRDALAAARNKREQRFAHIVSNSGVVVLGVRAVDREIKRLFLPLAYFDITAWPVEKRQQWAEAIVALAHEDVVVPRLQAADSALAKLAEEESDASIRDLIQRIRTPIVNAPEIGWRGIPSNNELVWVHSPINGLIASEVIGTDLEIVPYLPLIVSGLVGLDEGSLGKVRQYAASVSGVGYTSHPPGMDPAGIGGGPDLSDRGQGSYLTALADDKEWHFGQLMGYQQQVFPALPAPSWVFES